jgi:hypothetical protein
MVDVWSTGEGDSVRCMSGAKIRTGEEENEARVAPDNKNDQRCRDFVWRRRLYAEQGPGT